MDEPGLVQDHRTIRERLVRRWEYFLAWAFCKLGIVRLRSIYELDEETGLVFKVSPGNYFWIVSIGGRDYYIVRATGEYDGWGQAVSCEDIGDE